MFGPKRKDAAFFDGLARQAALNVRAAGLLQSMFARMEPASTSSSHPYRTVNGSARTQLDDEMVVVASDIKAVERDGDRLKHDAMKRVRANWMTPLDREDMRGLVHGMDDVLDRIDAVAERIVVYGVNVVTEEALELARLVVMSCDALLVAMRLLPALKSKNASEILERCAEVNRIETAADGVHRRAMGVLFAAGNDPLLVMKWRDVYDGLEAATDSCEDVADVAEGVVLEYA
jgi:predicted phosphate transport protein (TIGR00153 family)